MPKPVSSGCLTLARRAWFWYIASNFCVKCLKLTETTEISRQVCNVLYLFLETDSTQSPHNSYNVYYRHEQNTTQHMFLDKQKKWLIIARNILKIRNKLGNLYVKHLNQFITIPPL